MNHRDTAGTEIRGRRKETSKSASTDHLCLLSLISVPAVSLWFMNSNPKQSNQDTAQFPVGSNAYLQ